MLPALGVSPAMTKWDPLTGRDPLDIPPDALPCSWGWPYHTLTSEQVTMETTGFLLQHAGCPKHQPTTQ